MKIHLSLLLFLTLILLANGQSQIPNIKMPESGDAITDAEKAVLDKAKEDKKYDYILISKYIESEFIAKAEKRIAKLEKQVGSLKKKIAKEGLSQKAAEKYQKELDRLTAKIEAEKLWEKYKKAYVLCREAYNKKEYERVTKARALIKKIKVRYQSLTEKKFPPLASMFYSKYKDKLPELRKKHIN